LTERLAAVEGAQIEGPGCWRMRTSTCLWKKETILYSIAVESLNNIMKYAKCQVRDHLAEAGQVYGDPRSGDDGCGFDPQDLGTAGMGLGGMPGRLSKVEWQINHPVSPRQRAKINCSSGMKTKSE